MAFCIICGKTSNQLSQKCRCPTCQKRKGTKKYNTHTGKEIK